MVGMKYKSDIDRRRKRLGKWSETMERESKTGRMEVRDIDRRK